MAANVPSPNPFDEKKSLHEMSEAVWQKCEVLVEEANDQAKHNREQGSILIRWSVTTCMTLNVGALVATLNASGFAQNSRFWAGIWFLGGTVISLITGWMLASSFLKIGNSHAVIAKDAKLALKLRDFEMVCRLEGQGVRQGEMRGGAAFFLSFISVLAFVIGAIIMVDGAT